MSVHKTLAAARREHELWGGYLLVLGDDTYLVCDEETAVDVRCGSPVAATPDEARAYLETLAPSYDESQRPAGIGQAKAVEYAANDLVDVRDHVGGRAVDLSDVVVSVSGDGSAAVSAPLDLLDDEEVEDLEALARARWGVGR